MKTIPIVIPCYNRISSLKRLLLSLENAIYNDEIPLIFSVDYSGKNDLYNFVKNYKWEFGEKQIIAHSTNLGLKNNILFCGNLTNKYDAVIVLEDDLVVAKDFYNYAIQAYNFYKNDERIAGISLYKYERAEIGLHQFYPIETNYDAYLMSWPSSWGQMWTKEQWNGFKSWFDKIDENIEIYNIPDYVKKWDVKSWKKWAVAYLSVSNKYYLYPYKSFTNEFGTIGEHYSTKTDLPNINTVSLFCGDNNLYTFGLFNKLPKYDCFFQPVSSEVIINGKICHTTFNIYNCRRKKNIDTEYVISPIKVENKYIIASYQFLNFPVEINFNSETDNISTSFFFLYETNNFKDRKMSYYQKLQLRILRGTFESLKYYLFRSIKLFISKFLKF